MQLGMIGLGRMGSGLAERLRRAGHEVIGYDRDPAVSEVTSLADLVRKLDPPRVLWVMVPAGDPTQAVLEELSVLCHPGDLVVDGGNSNFRDSMQRAGRLAEAGVAFADAGTSGGVWGLDEGYCLMVGAGDEAFARLEPVLADLAPTGGYAHVGPPGAGHFVKMIHNGIEYGLLQAYAEGFELLAASEPFPDLDLPRIAELWRHGSVVRSWLLDLAVRALRSDPRLETVSDFADDSGEGRWTLMEAVATGVPAPITALALFARFCSRQESSFAMKLVSALRREFGGHPVRSR